MQIFCTLVEPGITASTSTQDVNKSSVLILRTFSNITTSILDVRIHNFSSNLDVKIYFANFLLPVKMALKSVMCEFVLHGCRVLNLFAFSLNKVLNQNGLIFTQKCV